jgi:hypothetical protein
MGSRCDMLGRVNPICIPDGCPISVGVFRKLHSTGHDATVCYHFLIWKKLLLILA